MCIEKAIENDTVEPYGLTTWPGKHKVLSYAPIYLYAYLIPTYLFVFHFSKHFLTLKLLSGLTLISLAALLACDQLEERFMKGSALKDKVICDVGCGTGLVTLSSILLGAKTVIATDINEEALMNTRIAVERLLNTYPQFKDCNVVYQKLDMKDETIMMPNCNFGVMSDIMYYNDMARVSANRAFEMMIAGAEILVTDPGREVRNQFLAELKELSGTHRHIYMLLHTLINTCTYAYTYTYTVHTHTQIHICTYKYVYTYS